jgi:outer membrane receptor for ferrienterochelin and colicins
VKYEPGNFTLRGNFSRGFRPPSVKQLYLEFIDSNHEILGNENLKSEEGYNLSFSGNYSQSVNRHNFDLSLSAFYNSIQNAIHLAIDTSFAGYGKGKYFNLKEEKYKTQGFEFKIKYHFFPRITFTSGLIITGRSIYGSNNEYAYSTNYASSLQYSSPKYNYEIGVFYKYNDEYLEFEGNFDEDGELINISQRPIAAYHIMDITLSKNFRKLRITIFTGIRNLFDVTMVDSAGNLFIHDSGSSSKAVDYGRVFFIGLNYKLEKL